MKNSFTKIAGGVTAPKGFQAAGVAAGIKHSRPDIALIHSAEICTAAAVFTRNTVKGDHIALCQQHLKDNTAQTVVINSGCANACVGRRGTKDANDMAKHASTSLGNKPEDVLVCSTGTIGIPLPMTKVKSGIEKAAAALKSSGGTAAARAIMTTDTRHKQCAVELTVAGQKVRVGGMAKGSGMIEPNMATMLAFVTTDADVSAASLRSILSKTVDGTFNRISIDGDQSCNDTVIAMANGAAGAPKLSPRHRDWKNFAAAVEYVCHELAIMIVKDGEGATKFVKVTIKGGKNQHQAESAVRAIANSLLVKTSWFGGDPNWGRIIDAAGYSDAEFDPAKTDISFNGVPAVKNGCKARGIPLKVLEKIYGKKDIEITVNLKAGKASAFVFTCDCSFDYVRINSEYMT